MGCGFCKYDITTAEIDNLEYKKPRSINIYVFGKI